LANFDFDQAEGLRRMLAGPKPRIVTFLSATPEDDKGAMLVNLGASLARAGNDVMIVDACEHEYGVAQRLGVDRGNSLLQVARQECALNQVIHQAPQGFKVASMVRKAGGRVGGEFSLDDSFPLPIMDNSEIVVQVSASATSITSAYKLVKRLSQQLGRRPFGILVTGASEAEAKVVYDNMATAATRYLAVPLSSMGSVPADEYLHRAARLGRAVVDAFPLAGASVAFRQLAGRFALPGIHGNKPAGGSAHFGL
jgi:flagellar biosynthesis protein FlhG